VVHIVVAGYILDHYCLMFDRAVVHIVVAGYIVNHYCLMFDRKVVHIVVDGYIFLMVNNIASHKNTNHFSVNSNGQQYSHPQQYGPLFCQTSNSNG
jgi:hypothetical protein